MDETQNTDEAGETVVGALNSYSRTAQLVNRQIET